MTGTVKLKRISFTMVIGLWALAGPTAASAQSRYSNDGWQNPSAPSTTHRADQAPAYHEPRERRSEIRMRKLLERLRGLIREARQARAAEPWFLDDLRRLVRRYGQPRRKRLLFDNFSDGNLSHNPKWRASGSGIHVSSHKGLRLRYRPGHHTQNHQNSRQSSRDELIGTLLGQLTGRQAQQQPQRREIRAKPPRLTAALAIPNPFIIELVFGSESRRGGRFVVGVTQGKRRFGYRLAYNPGSNQPIELIRLGRSGAAIIDAMHGRLNLEDGRLHKIEFSRDRRGEIIVRIDGKVLIRTTDRAFRGEFDGVVMINRGGDYTIRSIQVARHNR
jgi:hypothetical protein